MTLAAAPLAKPKLPSLNDLACKWGTDKRAGIHNYTKWYEAMWAAQRLEPVKFLEIGVQTGASLRMWEEFFPNGRIVGIDVDPRCQVLESKRVSIVIGSQDDPAVRDRLSECHPKGFDIIIDDGSHVSEHMEKSFDLYFPILKPGGTYVIEDLHCSYNPNYQGNTPITIMNWLKARLDDVNLNGSSGVGDYEVSENYVANLRPLNSYERDIESMTFVRSMAVITKRLRSASQRTPRPCT
jgi:predicted O-methyltransferase YrrM